MTKGDDLWGDKPALGPGSKFGGVSESAPADTPDIPPTDVAASADASAPIQGDVPTPIATRLDIEGDRIDGLSTIDLAKKQAFELTAIRLLLERLSDQMDQMKRAQAPEPAESKPKTQP